MSYWLIILLILSTPAYAGDIHVSLRAESVVSGSQVTLGEIADLEIQDAATFKQLAAISVAYAPAPGRSITLYPGVVLARLRAAGIDQQDIDFQAPERVVISTDSQEVSPEQITSSVIDFVRRHYPIKDAQFTIRVIQKPKPLTVTTGHLRLSPHTKMSIPRYGRSTITVDVLLGENRLRTVQVPVEIHLYNDVWVAKKPIRRGSPLQSLDFKKLSQDAASIVGEPLTSIDQLHNYRARQDMPTGSILTTRRVERIPIIERGKLVQVEIQIRRVCLRFLGKALNSAGYGEMVEFLNGSTGKRIKAQVVSSTLARVLLE